MSRLFFALMVLASYLYALEIPTQKSQMRMFGDKVGLNSQVIQLSNAKVSVMSMVGGHIEKYFIKPAQQLKAGDKIAQIDSIMLSKMSADYISLKEQFVALSKNYNNMLKLYEKGMTSEQELNNIAIKKDAMLSRINALRSQLNTLGIDTKNLKEATSTYTLYAHSSGKVAQILQPLHSVVSENTPIITIVKREDNYLKTFLPLEYASKVKVGQKITINYRGGYITTHVSQILPEVDSVTQRIILLSPIDDTKGVLYINAYVESTLYFDATERYVAVKKSALSFFNNEWVVFLPKEAHEEEGHDEHDQEQAHDEHDEEHEEQAHNEHDEEEDDDDHGHGHEEHEAPYEVRVVELITQDESYVAIKGLDANVEYVSDNAYFVKSMLLKSSLGEHGH